MNVLVKIVLINNLTFKIASEHDLKGLKYLGRSMIILTSAQQTRDIQPVLRRWANFKTTQSLVFI